MQDWEAGVANASTNSTPLEELQDQFAIIDLSGEIRFIDRMKIQKILSGKDSVDPIFYKKPDATLLMKRNLETLPYSCKPQIVINEFLVAPSTVMYQGTAFTPAQTSPFVLNFWVGPQKPIPNGNCTVILDHLFAVICDRDGISYDYFIKYLAHMIQKPEEKPGVIVALLGRQGTGKGMFFNLLRAVWTHTTLQVTDVDQVVGRFNACLERNFVVCMDEALFAGDRKALDRLKSMVTEPQINIEQKYQPSRTIGSVHRFFAASNHDHFAHVEMDDRRFVFLRVSDARKQDAAYFSQLAAAINDPATIGAFVHHLQGIDLTSFDARKKLKTNENLAQQVKSLHGFDRYWYEVLLSEDLNAGTLSTQGFISWGDPIFISTTSLVACYTSFNKNAQKHQTVQSAEVVANVKRLCPSAQADRHLGVTSGLATKAQKRGLKLPDIATARGEFQQVIGGEVPWT